MRSSLLMLDNSPYWHYIESTMLDNSPSWHYIESTMVSAKPSKLLVMSHYLPCLLFPHSTIAVLDPCIIDHIHIACTGAHVSTVLRVDFQHYSVLNNHRPRPRVVAPMYSYTPKSVIFLTLIIITIRYFKIYIVV